MSAREKIRKADVSKLTVNERTKKADSEKSENRILEKTENYIIKMTERTEKQNIDESVKNEFFSDDTSFFLITLFSESRNSERMRRIAIIMTSE